MHKFRYIAITLGLLTGFAVFWQVGLGGSLSAPGSMADSADAPQESVQAVTTPAAGPTLAPVLTVSPSMPRGVVLSRQYASLGYLLYLPTSATRDHPITVLMALRGIGDKPEDLAAGLVPQAEANGWLLVVPGMPYGDWKQVEALKTEEHRNLPWLKSLLDTLPRETSLQLQRRILIYGFSRGGQSAHRFALMYPRRVLAVALMSAGTYTLPVSATPSPGGATPLEFPVGVSDLARYSGETFDPADVRKVSFWVGVGEKDNSPNDLPRSWDRYIGTTRVERAEAFARAMSNFGARVEFKLLPKLGHEETAASRAEALGFLKKREESDY